MEEDKKEPVEESTITLTVKDASGGTDKTMQFKVKKTTKFSKVFEAYAQRLGVQSASMRFIYEGKRVIADATPKFLEMEDNDEIEAMIDQQGGGADGEKDGEAESTITLTVKDADGAEMHFKLKKTAKFSKIFDSYAARKGIEKKYFRFLNANELISGEQTPKMLELEDGDVIDARIEQLGGL